MDEELTLDLATLVTPSFGTSPSPPFTFDSSTDPAVRMVDVNDLLRPISARCVEVMLVVDTASAKRIVAMLVVEAA